MSVNNVFKRIFSDLQAFLEYFTSLWGLLSGFTAFFPLFNKATQVIPPPREYPEVCILLATLSCIFIVFYEFTDRENPNRKMISKKQFFVPLLIVLTYLFFVPKMPSLQVTVEQSSGLNFLTTVFLSSFVIAEPVMYIMTFYLFTEVFASLAVQEWRKRAGYSSSSRAL